MKINAYLFISQNGSLRVTKRDNSAYPNELGVELVVDVPDIFFKRPIPKVEVSVPEEFLINPDAEVAAGFVSYEVAEALKLDVKTVTDGLVAMLKEKQAKDEVSN